MSILKTAGASRALRLGLAVGVAGATLVGAVVSGQTAQAATTGLSPATGPTAGGNVVALSGAGFANAAGTSLVLASGSHGVSFQATTCATSVSASATDVTTFSVVSDIRLVLTVPAGVTDTVTSNVESKKDWNLCVYAAATGNKLLASAKYTVYPKPTLDSATPITPKSGPSFGGQSITVLGDTSGAGSSSPTASGYFSSKTIATLGGV